jgi:uncharacterized protein YndB with AHSA1/START domain
VKLVEREVVINAPPATVYRYLTTVDGLLSWMAVEAVSETVPGGAIRWTYENGAVMLGRYLELIPPRRIVFSYGWQEGGRMGVFPETTQVEIDLLDEGGKTRLRLLHRDLPDDHADAHEAGWTYFLGRLAALFAGPTATRT